jgi:hypothetical protein
MAWNPSPEVAAARDAAAKLDADQVVIVYIRRRANQIGSVTYGQTKQLCDETKPLGDAAYEAVYKHLEAQ